MSANRDTSCRSPRAAASSADSRSATGVGRCGRCGDCCRTSTAATLIGACGNVPDRLPALADKWPVHYQQDAEDYASAVSALLGGIVARAILAAERARSAALER